MDLYCFFDERQHDIMKLYDGLRDANYNPILLQSKIQKIDFIELKRAVKKKFKLPYKDMVIFRLNNIQIEEEHLEDFPIYFKLQTGFSLVTVIDKKILDELNKSDYYTNKRVLNEEYRENKLLGYDNTKVVKLYQENDAKHREDSRNFWADFFNIKQTKVECKEINMSVGDILVFRGENEERIVKVCGFNNKIPVIFIDGRRSLTFTLRWYKNKGWGFRSRKQGKVITFHFVENRGK